MRNFVLLLLAGAACCYSPFGNAQPNEAEFRLIPAESFSPEVGRWSPHVVDGQVVGVTIASSLFTEIGLRPGDLIVAVNGRQLADEGMEPAVEFSPMLVNRAPFELLVRRGATTVVVRYAGPN
jgi:S1-C subfamily serine protease